ncbi:MULTISPECIES: c-type cytochrome [unclassified Mucilaginibacter]|uniref:c-type cytochrome n=1 Tax=unclassified Mucilaginibacter TaxID=2617802 RepID=UPI002AC90968|nr:MULTISPECIES: c-type cytochrome [unclassified Mucilaginibacter]MEB0263125.1 c-type cytochrome [Mucilaginibacter sp. 10I4]MEB0280251.1 c-type cytochrome [Mucilaginibacter sp. 10B2]MEB0300196.1 c-type cytochrome [Mucilaginibacter sp. 5C4]WPX25554.1 c-type cytochrome [Mucilaginibacter sp. 5C4]
MTINKKLLATIGLLAAVVFMAMVPAVKKPAEEKFKNLKVLPKDITGAEIDKVMEEWEHALGARCSFCHVRNEDTKKMDFAADGKPEKDMAREMYKMTQGINKKYFHAEKDSTGVIMESSVNCYSCHRGVSHPEVVRASDLPRQPSPAPAPGQPGWAPGASPAPGTAPGTPPPPPPAPPVEKKQ